MNDCGLGGRNLTRSKKQETKAKLTRRLDVLFHLQTDVDAIVRAETEHIDLAGQVADNDGAGKRSVLV